MKLFFQFVLLVISGHHWFLSLRDPEQGHLGLLGGINFNFVKPCCIVLGLSVWPGDQGRAGMEN